MNDRRPSIPPVDESAFAVGLALGRLLEAVLHSPARKAWQLRETADVAVSRHREAARSPTTGELFGYLAGLRPADGAVSPSLLEAVEWFQDATERWCGPSVPSTPWVSAVQDVADASGLRAHEVGHDASAWVLAQVAMPDRSAIPHGAGDLLDADRLRRIETFVGGAFERLRRLEVARAERLAALPGGARSDRLRAAAELAMDSAWVTPASLAKALSISRQASAALLRALEPREVVQSVHERSRWKVYVATDLGPVRPLAAGAGDEGERCDDREIEAAVLSRSDFDAAGVDASLDDAIDVVRRHLSEGLHP